MGLWCPRGRTFHRLFSSSFLNSPQHNTPPFIFCLFKTSFSSIHSQFFTILILLYLIFLSFSSISEFFCSSSFVLRSWCWKFARDHAELRARSTRSEVFSICPLIIFWIFGVLRVYYAGFTDGFVGILSFSGLTVLKFCNSVF